jgi:hypothetical protein
MAAELLRGKVNLDVWITPKHIGPKDLPTDMKGSGRAPADTGSVFFWGCDLTCHRLWLR